MVMIRIEGLPKEVNKTIDHLKKHMAVYAQSLPFSNQDSEQIQVCLELNPNAEELYVYYQDDSLAKGLVGGCYYNQDVPLASLSDVKRLWGFTNMDGTILHLKEGCYIVKNKKANRFKVQVLEEKDSDSNN